MLGLSESGLGGQDAPDGFPASGRNAYPPGANAFFADEIPLPIYLSCNYPAAKIPEPVTQTLFLHLGLVSVNLDLGP